MEWMDDSQQDLFDGEEIDRIMKAESAKYPKGNLIPPGTESVNGGG